MLNGIATALAIHWKQAETLWSRLIIVQLSSGGIRQVASLKTADGYEGPHVSLYIGFLGRAYSFKFHGLRYL